MRGERERERKNERDKKKHIRRTVDTLAYLATLTRACSSSQIYKHLQSAREHSTNKHEKADKNTTQNMHALTQKIKIPEGILLADELVLANHPVTINHKV